MTHHLFNRRDFLALSSAGALTTLLPYQGLAAIPTQKPLHALSVFGEVKYGPDFTHFDYGNLEAPKGGSFNFSPPTWGFNQGPNTFNTLNTFVLQGTGPIRMEMCYDSLMTSSLDEPSSIYGLLAKTVTISPDRNSYLFKLHDNARFHDGTKLSAHDCAFTYNLFAKNVATHPSLRLMLHELVDAKAHDELTFELIFSGKQSDRAIMSAAGLPILQKSFFDTHPHNGSQMIAPTGSGPYKVKEAKAGTYIIYERDKDYWGIDLPVNRGLYHFDELRIDYFRDRQAGFEAFKKGNIYFRTEPTSKLWATGYNFPAINDGRIVKRTFTNEKFPLLAAWALNQRRERFADQRVREAISYCFDYQWTNHILFYDSYERSQSIFSNSPFVAHGLPNEAELEIMEPLRGKIPDSAFGEAITQPVSDGSGRDRKLLGHAAELFKQAGYRRKNSILYDAQGNTLTLELLVRSEVFVRSSQPFMDNLKALGVAASIRVVDAAQYETRINSFDFDMVGISLQMNPLPTRETLREVLSSIAAKSPGSYNFPGVSDEIIDELINRVGDVQSVEELQVLLQVIDRILRARLDWIPTYHATNHRCAFWDRFGFDENKPEYGFPVEILWWEDKSKVEALENES